MVRTTALDPSQADGGGAEKMTGASQQNLPSEVFVTEETIQFRSQYVMFLPERLQIPASMVIVVLMTIFVVLIAGPYGFLYSIMFVPRMRALFREYKEKGEKVSGQVVGRRRTILAKNVNVFDVTIEYDSNNRGKSSGLLDGGNSLIRKTLRVQETQLGQEHYTTLLVLPGKPKSAMPDWEVEERLKFLTKKDAVIGAALGLLNTFLVPSIIVAHKYSITSPQFWLADLTLGIGYFGVVGLYYFWTRPFESVKHALLESGEYVESWLECEAIEVDGGVVLV